MGRRKPVAAVGQGKHRVAVRRQQRLQLQGERGERFTARHTGKRYGAEQGAAGEGEGDPVAGALLPGAQAHAASAAHRQKLPVQAGNQPGVGARIKVLFL
ncbi:hypothetical protein D3C81_1566070 [compost metagenome]